MHRKSLLLTIGLFLSSLLAIPLLGQMSIDWYDLEEVSFAKPESGHKGPVYGAPHFPQTIKNLEGKTLTIQGYMLPLTVDNQLYVLSRYPFTECFFCGGAGKETVIELKLAREMHFDLDEEVIIQGKLRLVDDPLQLSFVLEDAIQVNSP